MLPPRLRPLLAIGLILMCTSAFARTNEPVPPTWSEIEKSAFTLLEQEKFEEALALVEQTAPKLQGREFVPKAWHRYANPTPSGGGDGAPARHQGTSVA